MSFISLGALELLSAALLVVLLSIVSVCMKLGVGKSLILAAIRMTVQLLLIGMVLRYLFSHVDPWLVIGVALIMLVVAGREIRSRQQRRLRGFSGYGIGVGAMFISSFTVTFFALVVIVQVEPWYTPQYAIPLLGMLLGNTMTGISLACDRLTSELYEQRNIVEQRLYLGEDWKSASNDIRKKCMRTGMVPMINAMAAAGIVSLPGMMTGQILGGTPPIEAVKYQILIMFLITVGTGVGVITAIWLMSRSLFNDRHRLCLERLHESNIA